VYQTNHTFAICAYKESPYLEDCILSLKAQSVLSNLLLSTSTPNRFLEEIAQKYDIPLFINTGEKGITQDWNFAYGKTTTEFVTIAHQDDKYHPDYVKTALSFLQKSKRPLIFFTDYAEIRNGEIEEKNLLLNVKRKMLLPLKPKIFQRSRFIRRRVLSLGDPICCPSVTFSKSNLPPVIFRNGFKSCEDWEAWEILSRLKGSFLYSSEKLTYHRIHEESATTEIISENVRNKEDYMMFCKFWPKPIAKFLAKKYAKGEESNTLQ